MKKAAVAGGIAWAVPAITSFEPVAAAIGSITCPAAFCFDNGTTNGWTIDNSWSAGSGLWKLSTARAFSAPTSLHYGRGIGGNYAVGSSRNAGRVTSPVIRMPATGTLTCSFRVWRQVETYTPQNYDVFRVSATSTFGTSVLYSIGCNGGTGGVFSPISVTIPAGHLNRDVTFQIDFDTVDGTANNFEGIYVDNFQVPCAYPPTVAGLKARLLVIGPDGPPPVDPDPAEVAARAAAAAKSS